MNITFIIIIAILMFIIPLVHNNDTQALQTLSCVAPVPNDTSGYCHLLGSLAISSYTTHWNLL